jgi:hypothetical protein
MFTINVKTDLNKLTAALTRLEHQQLPFATAQALTAVARKVTAAETGEMAKTFSGPTPFTMRGPGVIPARKNTQTATVFMKDAQAAYLAPYLDGGPQPLGSKQAILTPRDINLNQYGNIPRNKISALKGQPGIFIGTVTFKTGKTISGVWQRGKRGTRRSWGGGLWTDAKGVRHRGKPHGGGYGSKGRLHDYGVGQLTSLKLLVQFTRPAEVTHRLDWSGRARSVIQASLPAEFDAAMAKALATAR